MCGISPCRRGGWPVGVWDCLGIIYPAGGLDSRFRGKDGIGGRGFRGPGAKPAGGRRGGVDSGFRGKDGIGGWGFRRTGRNRPAGAAAVWIPAFAGMTGMADGVSGGRGETGRRALRRCGFSLSRDWRDWRRGVPAAGAKPQGVRRGGRIPAFAGRTGLAEGVSGGRGETGRRALRRCGFPLSREGREWRDGFPASGAKPRGGRCGGVIPAFAGRTGMAEGVSGVRCETGRRAPRWPGFPLSRE